MTLHTVVHLTGSIEAETAFDLALRSILTADGSMDRYEGAAIERNPDWLRDYPYDYIGTEPGQGLPAWTDAKSSRESGLIYPDPPDDDGDVWGDRQPWNVAVSWDTAYGYTGSRGESCSQLHGQALVILHRSLPDGVTMRWENEFTGDWHDNLDGLAEFMGEGAAARAFGNLVTVAIAARVAEGKEVA